MRQTLLRHFPPRVHPLTVVSDPDDLLADEPTLAELTARGFTLIAEADPVLLRVRVEAARPWTPDRPLVVITTDPLNELPYDLWQAGHRVVLSLHDFFPRLSYPVVRELTPAQRARLEDAPMPATTVGRQTSETLVLRHVFDADLDALRRPAALVDWLNAYHAQTESMPPLLRDRVLAALRDEPAYAAWDLPDLLGSAEAFAVFVRDQWRGYLQQSTGRLLAEEPVPYLLDFATDTGLQDDLARLVRTGTLAPVGIDAPDLLPPWARPGVLAATDDARHRRRADLLAALQDRLATDPTTWRWPDWQTVARAWAELTALTALTPRPPLPTLGRGGDDATNPVRLPPLPQLGEGGWGGEGRSLAAHLDPLFLAWLAKNYAPLAVQKAPIPHHVHHVPHALAFERRQGRADRIALLILDGMSLADWSLIGPAWRARHPAWQIEDRLVLAQLPTVTAVSRQALVSGLRPADFADSIGMNAREPELWRRFWEIEGLSRDAAAYERLAIDRTEPTLPPGGRTRALCLVESSLDEIVHGASLGTADVLASLRLWLHRTSPRLEAIVDDLLARGFVVSVASDHGHVEALGIGQPSEGLAVQTRGRRARTYRDRLLAERARESFQATIPWGQDGLLPDDLWALMPEGRTAFAPVADRVVTHGGPTLDEVVVPLITIALR